MRKLLWFTVGFSAAVAICAYLLSGFWMLIFALFCCLTLVLLRYFRKKIHPVIFVIMIGLLVGSLYHWGYDGLLLSAAKSYDGVTVPVEVTASDYSFQTDYGTGVDGKVRLNGRQFRTRLYLQGEHSIDPGDRIRISAKLRYTPFGGLEESTYHKGEGIFLIAYGQSEPILEEAKDQSVVYLASYLRKEICDRIEETFPKDTAAFAKALLIGDDSDITFEDNISFQKSGIRHVIAVSGLHVSILFSAIYFITRKNRMLVLLIGLPILFLFAAVAGFSPSIIRACLMQALLIIALVINREYDPGTALSFAGLVILIVNPLTITSVTFQLTMGCMIGIFLFSNPIREYFVGKMKRHDRKSWKSRLQRWFAGSVSISISAMIITMPLCAIYFGMVTVVGILANLLILWMIPFVFCGIILSCLCSVVWMPVSCLIAWIISWPIRCVLLISKILSLVPGGCMYTDSPYTVMWVVCTLVLVGVFAFSKRRSPVMLTAGIVLLYALSLIASWAEPRLTDVQVTVLDVGQGQCVLLQCQNDTYMIDCGGSDPKYTATTAINAIGAQGIHQLDGLILTHYDDDHCNAVTYLLETVPVKQLYLPDDEPENGTRKQLEKMDVPIKWVRKNIKLNLKKGSLELFPGISGETGNESSVCILFRGEKCDILITGDRSISGEHILLEQEDIPELELLVAGHHGASTSTGLELLHSCTPAVVAISAGADNRHGHPDSETLERLRAAGCVVRRTDLEGTIIFRG